MRRTRTNVYKGVLWADLAVKHGYWPATIDPMAKEVFKLYAAERKALNKRIDELTKALAYFERTYKDTVT